MRLRTISMYGVLHENALHGFFKISMLTNFLNVWKLFGIGHISYVDFVGYKSIFNYYIASNIIVVFYIEEKNYGQLLINLLFIL